MAFLRRISLMVAILAVLNTSWCVAQEDSESTTTTVSSTPDKTVAGMMKLTLKEGLELEGTPVELDAIKMNSLFGEASIPIHAIAGIRFAQSPAEQTTVVLLNGDALTGEINVSDMKFVCEWGEAKVNVAHLVSVVFRPDLAWSGISTPNGQRWRLTKVQGGSQPVTNYPTRRVRTQ